MPHHTSYGYSGSNAVSANQETNVAMYAAGAAAAAAVVGAGAAYAYNSMYGDAYGDHRRRRANSFEQPDLCTVTAPGERNGDFMECQKCYDHYSADLSSLPEGSYGWEIVAVPELEFGLKLARMQRHSDSIHVLRKASPTASLQNLAAWLIVVPPEIFLSVQSEPSEAAVTQNPKP